MVQRRMLVINIKRESGYADKLRAYKVQVDGTVIGTIADGESKDFDVQPGAHTLRLTVDWAGSNVVEFQSGQKKVIHFRCGSRAKGSKILLAVVYSFFLFKKYIELERID